ncbi:MAG: 3-hydroxybutyryl-CoA dehydrogenase, partial [Acidobacteria bacterium]
MGHGIAQVAAMAGYETRLMDADGDVLGSAWERIRSNLAGAVSRGKLTQAQADAAVANLTPAGQLETAARDADLILEAIVEDLAVKQSLFQRLDAIVPDGAILATNTSSLSIARIAEATKSPSRVVGMHFFNPVHIMRLVEIVTHG